MFFQKDKGLATKSKYGRLYVLRITLDTGKIVHKVGLCYSDRSVDRMMEVLRSFFSTYRYIPMCVLKRDKKVLIPDLVEKHMHELLAEWSYQFDKKFNGSTEFFENLDEEVVLKYLDSFEYTRLLENKTTIKESHLDRIREVLTLDTQEELEEIPF